MLKQDWLILTYPIYEDIEYYKGLDVPRQKGDYVVAFPRNGNRYLFHRHFRGNHEFTGTYANINTGIEYYPEVKSHKDLDIDAVQPKNHMAPIIEKDKLIDKKVPGIITPN